MLIGVGASTSGGGLNHLFGIGDKRRHHDKGMRGSAAIHPNVVGPKAAYRVEVGVAAFSHT